MTVNTDHSLTVYLDAAAQIKIECEWIWCDR